MKAIRLLHNLFVALGWVPMKADDLKLKIKETNMSTKSCGIQPATYDWLGSMTVVESV